MKRMRALTEVAAAMASDGVKPLNVRRDHSWAEASPVPSMPSHAGIVDLRHCGGEFEQLIRPLAAGLTSRQRLSHPIVWRPAVFGDMSMSFPSAGAENVGPSPDLRMSSRQRGIRRPRPCRAVWTKPSTAEDLCILERRCAAEMGGTCMLFLCASSMMARYVRLQRGLALAVVDPDLDELHAREVPHCRPSSPWLRRDECRRASPGGPAIEVAALPAV